MEIIYKERKDVFQAGAAGFNNYTYIIYICLILICYKRKLEQRQCDE